MWGYSTAASWAAQYHQDERKFAHNIIRGTHTMQHLMPHNVNRLNWLDSAYVCVCVCACARACVCVCVYVNLLPWTPVAMDTSYGSLSLAETSARGVCHYDIHWHQFQPMTKSHYLRSVSAVWLQCFGISWCPYIYKSPYLFINISINKCQWNIMFLNWDR